MRARLQLKGSVITGGGLAGLTAAHELGCSRTVVRDDTFELCSPRNRVAGNGHGRPAVHWENVRHPRN
jgi:hypothetical protein